MEIKINDLEYAYYILNSPYHDYFDLDGKEFDNVMHDPIELPYPLKNSTFICKKMRDNRYSAGICIEKRDENAFKDISRTLERKIASTGKSFFKTSKDGTGYIINKESPLESPEESLLCINEYENVRIIAIGTHGAYPRILSDKDSFIENIKYLEKYSNIFLDVIYEKYFGKKTKEHNIPRNFIVYSIHNSP